MAKPDGIAERLFELRVKRELSQKQAADLIQVSTRHWQRFEAGVVIPTIPMLDRIAAAFEVERGDLL